ncbi:hypothetical protein [Salipiger mucosus]|uniref:Uncharacterized protein n=1 Tax=Salipiger mucosus DSM 16094 TaxID=1123237 RepID=S9QL09_9RHOB|nr:hypothetical protein [Salipiger mucosus]EPX82101.1 hypothetical protein Salmuc_02469 [Salipiger mucosus DSM 16094]
MVLRLQRRLGGARDIELGYGVVVSHRAFTYGDLREAEATAMRLARQTLPADRAFNAECIDDEDLGPEHDEALRGQLARHLVKLLLMRFGTGWQGVEGEDGAPAPLTAETLDTFLDLFPGVATTLHAGLLAPWAELEREGNGSAPLQDTATAEA